VRSEEAVAHYTLAIRSDPEDVWAYLFRATAYLDLGQYDDCIRDATRAIELGIGPPDWKGHPYGIRSRCHRSQGQYQQALKDAAFAIELQPDEGIYYLDRALAYEAIGEESLALQDISKALELDPDLEGMLRELEESAGD
jgi:tetratricopeptide (TPR) repeat protein